MLLTVTIILYIILFIVVLPLKFRGHFFLSVQQGYLLANVDLYGLPSIKFKIEADRGFVMTLGNKKSQLLKEQFIALAKKVKIDPSIIKIIKLRGFYVRGIFGADDAAITALSCASSTLVLELIDDWFRENPDKGNIYIAPDYDKARLELEINLVTVVSISMIIFTFFRILRNRRSKNAKRTK